MSEKNKDVVFRRIRGRIVPIRKKTKEATQGAIAAGAGVAIAVGAGRASGSLVKFSANLENQARDLYKKATRRKNEQLQLPGLEKVKRNKAPRPDARVLAQSAGTMARSNRAFKLSQGVQKYGSVIGGVLVGSGFTKLYESFKGKEATLTEEVVAATAGQVTASALEAGFQSVVQGGTLKRAVKFVLRKKFKL